MHLKPCRPSRTLLLVRGKLGDTIAAWPTIRAYADRHPEEEVWFAVRQAYAPLFENEPDIRVLPFSSSAALYFGILRLRLFGGIARMASLWGFGKAIEKAGRLSGAKQRCYIDGRFGDAYTHSAGTTPNDTIGDPAWLVACQLDPTLPRPQQLELPVLARRRMLAQADAIALTPVADEARKVIDADGLRSMARVAKQRFPGAPIWLLGNPNDAALAPLLAEGLPEGVVLKPFRNMEELIDALAHTRALFTVDTGVYHLAAAMGVPTTAFFGPTLLLRAFLPEQPDVQGERLPQLGNLHCEIKTCTRPLCLYDAVAHWAGEPPPPRPEILPEGCLLTETEANHP